jgi:hypothetical protein
MQLRGRRGHPVERSLDPANQTDAGWVTRGNQAQQWQGYNILGRGYAQAAIYYGDIEPDFNGGIGRGHWAGAQDTRFAIVISCVIDRVAKQEAN